jgi:GxxExxY protein
MNEIIYKDESYRIIGACFEVYNEKGCGFTEPVYQECLELELAWQSLPFLAQAQLPLSYKGRPLRQRFQPDFVCHGKIILEIKAVSALVDEHRSQVLNHLSATGYRLGLLVNFGHHGTLEWERIVK